MEPHRFTALDGLRGYAAIVVVITHAMMTMPDVADAYAESPSPPHGALEWITFSPLHLFWAGGEAVFVFFVLSGFVLALPTSRPSWLAYYAKRAMRLYLPAWGALAFSYACFAVVPHVAQGDNWWLDAHALDYGSGSLVGDITLGAPTFLNSPVWSLKWEVVFSLLLPIYIAVAVKFSRYAFLLAAGALIAIGVGFAAPVSAAMFLPMFALGVLMAVRRESLAGLADTLGCRQWSTLALAALLLLTVRWWTPAPEAVTMPLAAIGAGLTVFAFMGWETARRAGVAPIGQWLGHRSFSIYLIHEPVIVSLAFLLPASYRPLVALVGVCLALLAGEAFYRCVELPALQAARRVGRIVVARRALGHARNS